VRPLLPRIERVAQQLGKVVTLNRVVHSPTYNQLIQAAALAVRAEG
jgi:hypothetical protein